MSVPTPEQIHAFEAAPSQVAAAIAGLNAKQMQFSPADGEWSIHEVVVHLADSESVGFGRLRKTIAEEKPLVTVYDEEAWASNLMYHVQDYNLALTLFTALRRSTAALLRMLPAEAWERTCVHPERGVMSLYDVFQLYLDHGNVHLSQIERLKRALQ